ncbi:short-chain dehydrogenase [Mycobacterium florentinum]|uniref:Short-chain dehydrogenase n=1 Tax=Mycobacterium florentinum TaxID=292462 RepID=A0A1X1U8L2_MYCFL|nr:SDR family oxidoreductase [Mycobacterium florentinum]MCV7410646.1 SDR family oxidoreductase [Mycobacterium florentinum]ORV53161.1 short-chain dehydrogenase [Mycobacterium florentinum]BBX79973.1 dehydrogenase [Mycobacterium florentinum]
MARLSEKTAVVTGGGRGLGSAISTALAAEGARVLVVDRNTEAADVVVASIKAAGGSASAETLDISDREGVKAFGGRMLEQFGSIDVLVNNAGIAPRIRPNDPDQAEKWDQVIDVNLTAQWDITVALLPALQHAGASVIFLSSIAGFTAPRSSAAYGASKAAVRSLVQYFARTLGPTGGRANGLAPGRIKSDLMTVEGAAGDKFLQRLPLGRVGETDEIAGPAVFLASDMSSYVTGVTIPVDGGYLAL